MDLSAPTMHLRSMKDGDTYGDAALKDQALKYFDEQVAKGPGKAPGARYYESKVLTSSIRIQSGLALGLGLALGSSGPEKT